jgi:hypothetical protein
MTPHHLLEIVVEATSDLEAQAAARAYVALEPTWSLVKITRVRLTALSSAPFPDHWKVELLYTVVPEGLGL